MSDSLPISPADEHNRTLVGNTHPQTWTNPTPQGRYNFVVIGGGTAGLVTALGAAGLGAKVALIERHLLGGDCLNVGCVPSKAILAAARVAHTVRTAGDFGIHVSGDVAIDFAAVMERMRRLRAEISFNDSADRLTRDGVETFLGDAEFTDRGTIVVRSEAAGDRELNYHNAVIATGARAAVLPIDGLSETGYLTNDTLFELTERPNRLAIIGGGPIGSEMAQAFARLGTEVTLFERSERILSKDDPDASRIVTKALYRDGVGLLTGTSVESVTTIETDGRVEKRLSYRCGDTTGETIADEILVAVGRQPNVGGLRLEAAGVDYDDRAGIAVSDRLQTSNSKVWACGDCCSRFKFTHAADFMARTVIRNALFFGRSKLSALNIPHATYTEPEVAHVGLRVEDAERDGVEITTFRQEFTDVDRAILDGETEGFVRVHCKKGSDRILGATIVAAHAGDLISEIAVAMQAGMGLGSLANVIHPYPTQAEAIRKLGDQYNRTRVSGLTKTAFEKWLKWRR